MHLPGTEYDGKLDNAGEKNEGEYKILDNQSSPSILKKIRFQFIIDNCLKKKKSFHHGKLKTLSWGGRKNKWSSCFN